MHAALSQSLFEAGLANITEELLALRGWTVTARSYPMLGVTFHPRRTGAPPLHVRFDFTSWNELPPSISIVDASEVPLVTLPPTPGGQFNGSPHPSTGRSFVCMRGSREYHTHPSHLNDHWDKYREGTESDLAGLVTQVWHAWLTGQP